MSKQGLSNKLNWNLFQSKLGGCGYSTKDLSKLYLLYKSDEISDEDLEKCDLLDPYLKVSPHEAKRIFESPTKKSPTKRREQKVSTAKIRNIFNQPDEILFVMTDSMSIKEITTLCKSNKKLNLQLCDNDKFWARRLEKDFEIKTFTPKQIYKKQYKLEYMWILMTDYQQSILIGVYKTKEKAIKRAKYFLLKQIEEEDAYEDLDEFIKDYGDDNELTDALGRPMKTKKDFDDVFTSKFHNPYELLLQERLAIDVAVKGELYDFRERTWNNDYGPTEYLYSGMRAILKGEEFEQEDEYT